MENQTIVVLTMNTRHFTFTASGTTDKEARKGLVEAWAAHRSQYEPSFCDEVGMPAASYRALNNVFDINVSRMVLGQGYRDGQRLTKKSKPKAD